MQLAGGKVLSVVVTDAANCSAHSHYCKTTAFFESLGGVLEGLPSGDPKLLLLMTGRSAYLI